MAVIGLAPASAYAQLSLQVISEPGGEGVEADVFAKSGSDKIELGRTGRDGRMQIAQECNGRLISIKTLSPFYTNVRTSYPCQPDMTIKVKDNVRIASLEGLLKAGQDAAAKISEVRQQDELLAKLQLLQSTSNTGQWASIGYSANEVAALLREAGQDSIALGYSALAIQSTSAFIAKSSGDVDKVVMFIGSPVVIESAANGDSTYKGALQTTEAVCLLKEFKIQNSLSKTAIWDKATFEKALELEANQPR